MLPDLVKLLKLAVFIFYSAVYNLENNTISYWNYPVSSAFQKGIISTDISGSFRGNHDKGDIVRSGYIAFH